MWIEEPDAWATKGVHWHVYIDIHDGTQWWSSTRVDRLQRIPDAVLRTPEEVADWVADMTGKHACRREVHLIGPTGGVGWVGDDGHVEHDRGRNLDVACRGDSVYADVRRENDSLLLWVEAVTECPGGHDTR